MNGEQIPFQEPPTASVVAQLQIQVMSDGRLQVSGPSDPIEALSIILRAANLMVMSGHIQAKPKSVIQMVKAPIPIMGALNREQRRHGKDSR
jgi:hypothetical protein